MPLQHVESVTITITVSRNHKVYLPSVVQYLSLYTHEHNIATHGVALCPVSPDVDDRAVTRVFYR